MTDIKNHIISLANSGLFDDARRECLAACENEPGNAEMWFILSAICGQLQDYSSAESYISTAIKINSSVPSAYYNLAITQKAQNKIDEAIQSFEKSIQLQGDFVASLFELGNLYLEKNDFSHAKKYYLKVINLSPDAFQAYSSLARAYEGEGEIDLAITASIESLRINSKQQVVLVKLAAMYDDQGNYDDALTYYKQAVEQGNAGSEVFVNIGRIHDFKGNISDAENFYKKALFVDQNSVEALTNIALLYEKTGDITRALENIEKANEIGSDDDRFMYNRAKILASAQRYTDSENLYLKIISHNPEFCEAIVNLGNLYLLSGKAQDAHNMYARACELKPEYSEACSNMLMSLNYTSDHSIEEIKDLHIAWAQKIESVVKRLEISDRLNSSNRLLRVGYVSADFRDHSVAYFLRGILKYSNKSRIVNYCYSDVLNKDHVTKDLKSYVDNWRDVIKLDNNELATIIQQDKIDVLIDLSGHTSGNRLAVFALKPSPLQVTYLGYPNTTGLSVMDYRIVDENTDPDGSEDMMSESPLYIEPCFLSYTPPFIGGPDITKLPALDNGYITFGSFNNLAKISDDVIETWSKILQTISGSKLCLKARQFSDSNIIDEHFNRFQKAGIEKSRLLLLGSTKTTNDHLQTYNNIDIALDTFPYNGTTTTFEALWMGVPVVCLSGYRHASRVSSTVLKTLDINELIADDQEQYVRVACDFANDIDRLATLRDDLRARMSQSPLMDCEGFTQKYESALLTISREGSAVD